MSQAVHTQVDLKISTSPTFESQEATFFPMIPAMLHPIALAVTYRNEWQSAARRQPVPVVSCKSSLSLEGQPWKLAARSDFHWQACSFRRA